MTALFKNLPGTCDRAIKAPTSKQLVGAFIIYLLMYQRLNILRKTFVKVGLNPLNPR
jgi:hypothetical protein